MKISLILFFLLTANVLGQYGWFEGNNLNSVYTVNTNEIIAVGGGFYDNFRFSTIWKTTDSGGNWDLRTKEATLHGISFVDVNNGMAVGNYGTIIRTTDGSKNWISQSSNVNVALLGISYINANTSIAVGGNGNILKTTDGGNTWINKSLPGIINTLHSVTFVDINNGWSVGTSGRILNTTDSGENWVIQNSGILQTLHGVSFANKNNGIAVGSGGTILKTTDGGENWTSQASGTSNTLYGISYIGNDWTAVGEWGTIIRNGVIQNSGTTNHLKGVSFINPDNGTAVGWFGTILRTTDGGVSWNNQLFEYLESYYFIYNGVRRYYVFLPHNYEKLNDLPVMFVLNGSGGTGEGAVDASRMSSVADTSGFIVVYPSPVGINWDLIWDHDFFSILIDTIGKNYKADLTRVYVSGFSYGGYMSHQLGCRLSHKVAAIAPVAGTIQSQIVINCLSTASPPVFYMHGTLDSQVPYTGVEQTLDFWIDRNHANVSVDSVAIPDVDTTDGSTIMKYSYKNSEGIARVVFYKVLNGGHNWSGTAYGYSGPGYKNMDVNTSQEIWNFVKDFVLEPTGVDEEPIVIPDKFILHQNYPNPFNPSTTISWQSPVSSWHTLKVYDLLGREVAILVDEFKPAGGYEVEFDAFQLSSGTYFYRLTVGGFVETKKLILLR